MNWFSCFLMCMCVCVSFCHFDEGTDAQYASNRTSLLWRRMSCICCPCFAESCVVVCLLLYFAVGRWIAGLVSRFRFGCIHSADFFFAPGFFPRFTNLFFAVISQNVLFSCCCLFFLFSFFFFFFFSDRIVCLTGRFGFFFCCCCCVVVVVVFSQERLLSYHAFFLHGCTFFFFSMCFFSPG